MDAPAPKHSLVGPIIGVVAAIGVITVVVLFAVGVIRWPFGHKSAPSSGEGGGGGGGGGAVTEPLKVAPVSRNHGLFYGTTDATITQLLAGTGYTSLTLAEVTAFQGSTTLASTNVNGVIAAPQGSANPIQLLQNLTPVTYNGGITSINGTRPISMASYKSNFGAGNAAISGDGRASQFGTYVWVKATQSAFDNPSPGWSAPARTPAAYVPV